MSDRQIYQNVGRYVVNNLGIKTVKQVTLVSNDSQISGVEIYRVGKSLARISKIK